MTNYSYKATDSGMMGKTFERDLKAAFNQKATVAKQGKIDFRRARKCYEVKTGAGELDYILHSSIKYVVYVPVVDMTAEVTRQEGFVMERAAFIDCLNAVGLIRSKRSTAGEMKTTIQTFWNAKQNKPHGAKLFALLDLLYENCLMTLEDYFENDGKLD